MGFETIILKKEACIATITLNRPEKLNAINQLMTEEIRAALDDVNRDDGMKVLILTGAGRGFCAGVDFGAMGFEQPGKQALHLGDEMRRILRGRQQIVLGLQRLEKPTIAMVNGVCVGAGFETACACDMRIAAETSRFALTHVRTGVVPWDGGTQRLSRLVGRGKAMEMILTGQRIDAREALRIGLVNRIVHRTEVTAAAMDIACEMAQKGPIALRYVKEAVFAGMDMTLEQGLRLEADLYFLLQTTRDRTEGVGAFIKKGVPHFEGK